MKIDLKKLQKTYVVYEGTPTASALKLMVDNVLNFSEAPYTLAPNNIRTAITTLVELKILILDDNNKPPVQQLNS
jgi:hypothetical protein